MSGLQSENFLAYKRSGRYGSKVELEVGVSYDFAAAVDEANNWSEPGAPRESDLEAAHEAAMTAAAAGLKTLLDWCFAGNALTKTGGGALLAFQRFVAVSYLVNSDVMAYSEVFHSRRIISGPSTPITLAQLAEQLDCSPSDLRRLAKEFRQRWTFKAHVQRCKAKRA